MPKAAHREPGDGRQPVLTKYLRSQKRIQGSDATAKAKAGTAQQQRAVAKPQEQPARCTRAQTAAAEGPAQRNPTDPAHPSQPACSPPPPSFKKAPKAAAVATTPASKRKFVRTCEVDGEVYHVGGSAYVSTSNEEIEEQLEPCEVCGAVARRRGRGEVPLLECDACLRGYHLDCLDPPIADVPEASRGTRNRTRRSMAQGAWQCPACAAGAPPAPRAAPLTLRERFLAGLLELAHIDALWRSPGGELGFQGHWYLRPEATHTGRQAHHGAREVFLTQQTDANPANCLLRPATVCATPGQFAAAARDDDDIFVCEYEYDTVWQRFRRLEEDGELAAKASDEEEEWDACCAGGGDGTGSDSEAEADATFRPVYALWAKRGLLPARNMSAATLRSAAARRAQRAKRVQEGAKAVSTRLRCRAGQGGGEIARAAGIGATEVPAARGVLTNEAPLVRARRALSAAAPAGAMPGREAERAAITAFIEGAVTAECAGQCLYVSGVPGTGKTATVLEAVRALRARCEAGSLPPFQFLELNALRLPSPAHAYSALYEALTGSRLTPGAAAGALAEMFAGTGGAQRGRGGCMTVVLVDEMDLLITRSQSVLYNLFEWPTAPGARLAVVGVANTMDLPERLLPRIASRLGSRRVTFQPYRREQLEAIVRGRLAAVDAEAVLDPRALAYASRKVAAVSGDVRRLLELCRKASEEAEAEAARGSPATPPAAAAPASSFLGGPGPSPPGQNAGAEPKVMPRHVEAALSAMFSAAHALLLSGACGLEKVVLACLLLDTKAHGHPEARLADVAARAAALCAAHMGGRATLADCAAAALRLGAKRLVLADPGAQRGHMRLALNMPRDDAMHVLHQDAGLPWLRSLNL